MSNILKSYPVFENNQVLTSTQLNTLAGYLDEQNRLTRAKLIGMGVICGLEVSYDNDTPTQIKISKGLALTSEGYIICMDDCTVDRYKSYSLPLGVLYPPFQNSITKQQDVTLYELISTTAPVQAGTTPISTPFVSEKVMILFLETTEVDLLSCMGKACDDNGKDRVFNMRKLAISLTDLKKVIARSQCGNDTIAYQAQYDLPEIIMHKPLFTPASTNSSAYIPMSESYVKAINSPVNPSLPGSGNLATYTALFNALKLTYTDFASLLAPIYSSNPFTPYPLATWSSFLNGTSTGPKYLGMQYFHDFMKDLVLAYNEFRDVAMDVVSQCCPNMSCFPKHVMIGLIDAAPTEAPSRYIHHFVSSPVFNTRAESLESLIFYFRRLVLMVTKFELSSVNVSTATDLKVTPSHEKVTPLSERSIPYYYDIEPKTGPVGSSLAYTWNYDYVVRNMYVKGLMPLSYRLQETGSDKGPVKTPFFYDLDAYNFLRIEGHLKMPYATAQFKLDQAKTNLNLPFNVVALRLNGNAYDNIEERCDFDDIRTMYGSLRVELASMIQNVFDRFGYKQGSSVFVKGWSPFMNALFADVDVQSTGSVQLIETGSDFQITSVDGLNNALFQLPGAFTEGQGTAVLVNPSAFGQRVAAYAPQSALTLLLQKFYNDALALVTQTNTLLTSMLPFNVTDFEFGYNGNTPTAGFIHSYFGATQAAINLKVDFNQILDLVIRTTKLQHAPEMFMILSAYWSETVGLLERFITDARYKSLTQLIYTLKYRLTALEANDMTKFSNFIKKHPGVQHQAGVPMGGTFILIYNGMPAAINSEVANSEYANAEFITFLTNKKYQLEKINPLSPAEQFQLNEINGVLLAYNQFTVASAQSIPFANVAIEGNEVIADFSLPYLCCCDCECEYIGHPTTENDLRIPTLTPPFYVEFSTGDYAFGKNIDVFANGCVSPAPLVPIDIVPFLQFEDNIYQARQVRLYLVDRFGVKINYGSIPSGEGVVNITPTGTRNFPNSSANGSVYGTVSVAYDRSFSQAQKFIYSPATGFSGIDSFYYMFEVVSEDNHTVIRKSSIGKVTISVSKACPSSGSGSGSMNNQ